MRLFFAVQPSGECRAALWRACGALRPHTDKGRFTSRENLHLTLIFLGEMEDESHAKAALQALEAPAFDLTFSGIGRFHKADGDILWAGVEAEPQLQMVYDALAQELRRQGVRVEGQPYTPHLTLARRVRFAPGVDFSALGWHMPRCDMRVEAVSLMLSHRVAGKLVYSELCRRQLGK